MKITPLPTASSIRGERLTSSSNEVEQNRYRCIHNQVPDMVNDDYYRWESQSDSPVPLVVRRAQLHKEVKICDRTTTTTTNNF